MVTCGNGRQMTGDAGPRITCLTRTFVHMRRLSSVARCHISPSPLLIFSDQFIQTGLFSLLLVGLINFHLILEYLRPFPKVFGRSGHDYNFCFTRKGSYLTVSSQTISIFIIFDWFTSIFNWFSATSDHFLGF